MNMENYNKHKKYYYDNGNIKADVYYLNDKRHRTDGPAYIWYYKSGTKTEYYYLNDNLHRTDGPAIIDYYESGNIDAEYYYLNNEYINVISLEEFKKYQKTLILK